MFPASLNCFYIDTILYKHKARIIGEGMELRANLPKNEDQQLYIYIYPYRGPYPYFSLPISDLTMFRVKHWI